MGGSPPCASCKLLRRRCAKDCIFAPFFPPDEPHKFAIVHKVFGASNVSKMLQELPFQHRADAVSSLVYEANARIRDPVYGCIGAIFYLQNQVKQLKLQLAVAHSEISCLQMQQRSFPFANRPFDVDGTDEFSLQPSLTPGIAESTSHSSYSNALEEHLKIETLWT
ncbi:hypothetical protein HPP92_015424 [Vanilla planifolia]|nr:hypothetical protein HPP92_015424 [Vanilla planifolia]